MKPEIISIADENNSAVRECPDCKGWYSLLGTKDENGVMRSNNHMPGEKGICTCHLRGSN